MVSQVLEGFARDVKSIIDFEGQNGEIRAHKVLAVALRIAGVVSIFAAISLFSKAFTTAYFSVRIVSLIVGLVGTVAGHDAFVIGNNKSKIIYNAERAVGSVSGFFRGGLKLVQEAMGQLVSGVPAEYKGTWLIAPLFKLANQERM